MKKKLIVLGIESSCDETGVAIYCQERGLLAHALHSQVATHRLYGGVVPELASRDHVVSIVPLVEKALFDAQLDKKALDAIAYTYAPGLVGALLVGASFAKSLAYSLGIPSLAVHHLEAHLLVAQLDMPNIAFPFTALLVSGGHTQLLEANALGQYSILGESLDDAVGEAFDKVAKRMGLPYPGGPLLAQLADQSSCSLTPTFAPFPRPMLDRPGLDFSFSGLKTHAMVAWEKSTQSDADRASIAGAFQAAAVDTLVAKCRRAMLQTKHRQLVVAGGVGANRALRAALMTAMQAMQVDVFFPRLEYCTDNGAMVAYTGCLHFMAGRRDATNSIVVKPRCPL